MGESDPLGAIVLVIGNRYVFRFGLNLNLAASRTFYCLIRIKIANFRAAEGSGIRDSDPPNHGGVQTFRQRDIARHLITK